MRKIRLLTAAALLLTAAAVTLTGCGAGNKFSETAAAETAAASADMASGFSAPREFDSCIKEKSLKALK